MTTLNEYLAEVIALATERGYDVMELDARGGCRVAPKRRSREDEEVEFRGMFILDTMRRCLRDISAEPKS